MSAEPADWVIGIDDRPGVARVGGKAAGLFRLLDLGLDVPPFAVLGVEAFRACCRDGVPDTEPAELRTALDRAWAKLGSGAVPLAVRSSAVDEDGEERSWAGQMETCLNVVDRQGLGRAVRSCWASLSGERALAYGRLAGAAPSGPGMAVVIQEMIHPDASGVLFTLDPVSGARDRMVVSAVLGLGEGLVSGALDADTWVLDEGGAVLEATIVDKDERIGPDAAGGVARLPVPEGRAREPALDEATLSSLARSSRRAADEMGTPLDIEFAVRNGETFYLQARPVTAAGPGPGSADGDRRVWDNANIVESYPGITLPLTFSFIRRAYHAVYWQFCQLLGLDDDEIRAQDHMLRNMLGLHQGQVYYNLLNWYRLTSILPGFRHNRRFMEGMMGVTEEGGDEETDRVRRGRGALALARTAVRAIWLQLSLERRVCAFHRTFDRIHAEFAALEYEEMPPGAVMAEYRRLEKELLWRWKAPIVNDFSVMVFYGLLKRLTVRWGIDPEGNLQNALVSRQGGIESARVSEELEELAGEIGADREFAESFLAARLGDGAALLRSHPEHGPRFARYLERYGDRCVAELKLESRTMHDDPAPLIAALQAALRRQATHHGGDDDQALAAEGRIRERLGPFRRLVYRGVLRGARRGIRNRENQRLARTRAFALVRRMMRAVGVRFRELGLLESEGDVFYLELDEIMDLCDGTATLLDPKPLVALRKSEYEGFRARPLLPDRFVTRGPAAVVPRTADEAGAPGGGEGVLTGLGAYPGLLEREAVVMLTPDPEAGLDGHILVTRQTDPGWVIIFPSIGGLVVERGSPLSHSAIVARELGIPCVVGVKHATSAIRTGDRVRLDGAAGTVVVIEPHAGDGGPGAEEGS